MGFNSGFKALIELLAMTCGVLWLMPLLLEDKPNFVLQDDRAPPHIQLEVATFLHRQLPELCFGCGGFTSWPLLSPALTLLDILLWDFVKDEVYIQPIPNLTWLQQMSTNSDGKIWTFIFLMYTGLQMEHLLNCVGYKKNILFALLLIMVYI